MDGGSALGSIILQVVLIVLNAFFAMSEIAVISINEAKALKLATQGRRGAKALGKLIKVPARFLATIQVGVTLSGFLGSAFAADNFAGPLVAWMISLGVRVPAATLNTIMVVAITIVIAFLTLVFGELVPKRIAMQRPVEISLGVAGIISFFAAMLRPVVALLTACTNGVIRLFGMDPHASGDALSEEEIRMMVDMGGAAGVIEPQEQEMIENVFELNNTQLSEVMTHRTDMAAISVADDDAAIVALMQESGYSRFPVFDGDLDDIVGILRARDYFLNAMKDNPLPLKDILMKPYFVPETLHTDALLREMQKRKMHIAIVVDEYGGTSGMVTMEDLIEEIVGDIYDESDKVADAVTETSPGVYRVPGNMDLETLGDLLGMKIGDEDVDTVGGLAFKLLGFVPEDGSQPRASALGLEIQVHEIADRRVLWALVQKSAEPNA